MRLDIGVHLQVPEKMSSARQSLGRLNDALSFIPTVMTTSLATAPGTEATGAPAARTAQIEQILVDALEATFRLRPRSRGSWRQKEAINPVPTIIWELSRTFLVENY